MRRLIIAVAACGLFSTAALAQTPPAAPALAGGAGPAAPDGGAWTECPVTAVGIYRDRLELKCGGPATPETPRVFAIESMDRMVDPVLRMALEAKARGKPLSLLYVKAAMANPAGCPQDSCRRIVAVESK